MRFKWYLWFLLISLIVSSGGQPGRISAQQRSAPSAAHLRAPAGTRPVKIDPAGETVLPNGRVITPLGKHVKVAPHPYGLALSPDGKTLVTANSGTSPFSISIITELEGASPKVVQIPPAGKAAAGDDDDNLESVWMGVAIAPDNRTLYLSEGDNGKVGVFDLIGHNRLLAISLDGKFQGKTYAHSLTGELKLSPDGKRLYVLDLAHFQMVMIDTASKQIVSRVPVGRMPFALAVSPDGQRVYVSNVGMFHYSLVPGFDEKDAKDTGLDFPPFGFPSKESMEGTTINGKKIPGVGDPNVPESNSVWVIDVTNAARPRVTAKIRTGIPIGEKSVGGSSPGAVVVGRKKVFVSNASQDSITILDARTQRVEKNITLEPAESVRGLRGVLPFGMALRPDEKQLYVACAGINAIAVIDARQDKVLGYFPTAWFPARVALSPNGKTIYVANAKGFGSGPNGGPHFQRGSEGDYIGDITKGVISVISLPRAQDLGETTTRVLQSNAFLPTSSSASPSAGASIPRSGQLSSKIKHVVFVVKENRTFDEVFGDMGAGNKEINGEPTLARWGEDATVKDKNQPTIEHARVTPNHHALARRFAFSDNFYVDGDVSMDGHHWLVGNYPNELLEAAWPAQYGKRFHFFADTDAPGRLGGVSYNPWPESFLEAGSLWEHLARHKITFRNYGEGTSMSGSNDGPGLMPTGIRESVNIPLPQVLFANSSRAYATFNTSISDQYRFEQFKREFDLRFASGKEPLPQFLYIWLPNDHTAGPRPEDGYAYHASYVADNDLALGKLVELFSHSPFWKDMAIFVTEDDAQDGVDHVDAHRSLLMVIGPYARRGVSHVHTSMQSILKTFFLIFGMPPLNQYDAAATDLSDMFTDQPDFTPYTALPSDTRIFDPRKVREPGLEMHARPGRPSEPLDDPATIRRRMRERMEDDD
ncbi:MAG: bifunctional YncE family protein/alkaline phosphatase family protein [Terriglobia bacterium]